MILFLLLILLAASGNILNAQVIINEFMASNVTVYPDMWDFEDFSDWIELHNTSNEEVDLTGYYLSDDLKDLKKWEIPSGTTIAANGFLVIYADGHDAKPFQLFYRDFYPWNVGFRTKWYHTSFSLSSDGEEIALSRITDGTVTLIDSVKFSNQLNDISFGRNPSGNNVWFQYDQPTPGAANTTDPKKTEIRSDKVSFSIPGGFYSAPQTVILTSSAGEIYYTVNGSIPDKNSTKYSSPLILNQTTTLRARCIESDKLAGKVTTNTYFVNEKSRKLMCISIAADSTLLYNDDIGVFENSLKGRELPIAIEFFTTDGKQVANANAGMRIGSLTNYNCPQKPLQIALKGGKYGDDYIWYQFYQKEFACNASFRLRQGGDGWNTNLITDGMLESICKGQLELGMQAYRPVVLFINGNYYGIHDLREQFDELYFINNFNVDPTTKDELRTTYSLDGKEVWELVSGKWDDWHTLLNLVKNEQIADTQKYNEVKSRVNINSLIDFVCIQEFGAGVSWGHNEDVWKVDGAKWSWLVTDFDKCFLYGLKDADILFEPQNTSQALMEQDTLFKHLVGNSEFKNYFLQRFAAHLNSTFKPSRMKPIVDSIAAMLSPEISEYADKWGMAGGVKSLDSWRASVDSIKLFMDERAKYVIGHLSNETFTNNGTAKLTINFSIPDAGEIFINEVPMRQELSDMTFFKGIPMKVKAVAKPGFVFAGWQSGVLTDTLNLILTSDTTVITAIIAERRPHSIPSMINNDTVFNLTDNPYVGAGDIHIPDSVTLTIEKGVTILMHQNADILVEGRLIVNGTSDSPVKIMPNTVSGVSNWGAVNFEGASDTSKLSYVEISGTTLGNDALNERGGVNGNNSNVVMDHLKVSNVIYPFYFEGGNTVLRNSHIIIDHICNGGIHIGRGGALVENNSWISTGKTMNTDAIDIKGVENGIVRGNRLYNFNGSNSDGIDLGENCKNILVEGNFIYGNRDKGISCGGASTCTVRNNIIVNCDLGIGIKDEGSTAEIDHNTFVRNRIAVAAYTKVFGRGGGIANVKNCILSASKGASFYADDFSEVNISYSISDVDLLAGEGNRFADPLFTDILTNNFQLKDGSPCINSGSPESEKDTDGSITDMGAQYTYDSLDFPNDIAIPYSQPIMISEIMFDDKKVIPSGDWIELYNATDKDISLANWKLCDKGDITYWENLTNIADVDSEDIFYFPESISIKAGSFLVVCREIDSFKNVYPNVSNLIGNLPFGISGEDVLFLYDSKDSLANVISFSSNAPWPKKNGVMAIENEKNLNYLPLNWVYASATPGEPNNIVPISGNNRSIAIPACFHLGQNYPNPFRTMTTIQLALPVKQNVTINVYDISGRLKETIVRKKMNPGYHNITWNARGYSSGVYFYRIQSESFRKTMKFTIQ